MFDLVLLAIFIWGVLDVLSGLQLLFWRTPILLIGMILGRKKRQFGYSKKELEQMFGPPPPPLPPVPPGSDVDEHGIPWLAIIPPLIPLLHHVAA